MSKVSDLTPAARQGYEASDGAVCPHFLSSPNGLAWTVGRWLRDTGRPAPRDVRAGRGYRMHANDMLLKCDGFGAVEREK